ncbi:nucleotidyltransferase domain-containing protein [Brachybacterium alimentarium]|uniref:nucleotidyltransferase domain-containing protein n=1 Tax=Brachybacterium alimentarium TaxID=47845 RepID=UPI003FCFC47C
MKNSAAAEQPAGLPTAGPLPPDAFHRWYGGWDPFDPSSNANFMQGFERPWWIIGGWAIEKWTGVARAHEDMDISIFASDAEAFRIFLADRWTTWNMDNSWLRPFDHRFRDVRPGSSIWVRKDAQSAWVLDVPLTPDKSGKWTNKKLPSQVAPLDDVTWVADDGLNYLRPEIALFMKHRLLREKDRADAATLLPRLDRQQRHWLRDAVAQVRPDHPWLDSL